ncbi:hypothetical protein TCAL_12976 [Tigriopus californicus]|uniref:EF-hand domain-containing protein n=1 Tax=Tigriopus californicus TaxID=6832 RepID=A0A553PGR5_TIGCA|nr:hypothetical protein TCAL_12976 [Tigriopus californicus]|eukprot:TCALIF_12976-PA protein Name:"Similar to RHBDL3 Rhomboid-related protein 3 (Homo sapiens)" AED:0.04 eAED:0.04 QI:0/-1/0/1/-1/1/1/0/475
MNPSHQRERLSLPTIPQPDRIRSSSCHSVHQGSPRSRSNETSRRGEHQKEIDRLFNNLDKKYGKDRGRIPTDEIVRSMRSLALTSKDGVCKNLMNRISQVDRDGDGYIVREEFYHFFHRASPTNSTEVGTNRRSAEEDLEDGDQQSTSFIVQMPEDEERDNFMFQKLQKYLTAAAYAERYTCSPPPWFILLVTISQIMVFIYHWCHFRTHPYHINSGNTFGWHGPYQFCSNMIFHPNRRYEWYRYLTYAMVHANGEHLVTNLAAQLIVGSLLEMSHGSMVVFSIYFSGILAGSFSTSLLRPSMRLAGGSPAVYALIGGHLASVVLNWNEDKCVVRMQIPVGRSTLQYRTHQGHAFRITRIVVILVYILFDLRNLVTDGRQSDVVYESHLNGFVVGLLVGLLAVRNKVKEQWETRCQWGSALILFALAMGSLLLSVLGNDLYSLMGYDGTYFMMNDYKDRTGHTDGCNYSTIHYHV